MSSVDVLGVQIAPLDLPQAVATVDAWIDGAERAYACLVNVHVMETARQSTELAVALHGSGLNLPDGAPVAWLASRVAAHRVARVTGSDLFAAVCSGKPRRHFFLGSTSETLERLRQVVETSYPQAEICGALAPPFRRLSPSEWQEQIEVVNAARPDIVWVGLGAPRQEIWMHAHRDRLSAPVLIGVGAVFDFASGQKQRAPRWMRHGGLEWLHRLATEPRRLWRRYLLTNTTFAVRAVAALVASPRSSAGSR
jgi:N-acetylglucosaminyldiphosphoundecaprenol N-acetyl-beta-D-mannosaminyltransferase